MTPLNEILDNLGPDSISYQGDTQILMNGHSEIFHHTDANTLTRVK